MTIHLPIICEEFARSWLRNPWQRWTIHLIHLT
jgi:hypothetical protein